MNAPFDLRLDKAAFDRWLLSQEQKYEWKEGRVVQMNNVTRDHASVVSNILHALRNRLESRLWRVVASDFGVEDQNFVRFPDVLVEPKKSGTPPKGRRSHDATVLFEVLSPASVDTDLIEKPEEYMALPTLEAYVVASQDAAICWLWQRDPAGRLFRAKPVRIAGRDQMVPLAALGIELPLAEIYEDIATADD